MLRVKPEVHAALAAQLAGQLAGKSMDQWSEEVLQSAAAVPG